ncbi:MAG TPA: ABC transporter permease [Gemmatimonadaceae bacterium]|nr:ABC transporter permease [Gemmatimonadaceae bacterium]
MRGPTRACARTEVRAVVWLLAAALTVLVCVRVSRAGVRAHWSERPWQRALARFRGNRPAMLSLYVVIALYVLMVLAPWLAPYSPSAQPDIVALKNQAPSLAHPFGTDQFSRDVFSRVLFGSRISLTVALLAVLLSSTAGTAYGAIAGYYGGRLDNVMMRFIDAALSIPRVLLLIGVLALWGGVSLPALVLLLGLTGWFGVSRLVRAQVMVVKELDMVAAARALGVGDGRILWRYVLPNALAPVIVAATLAIGNVVILEAGLSYLGIGVRQPLASWGNIIGDGSGDVATLWWISLFPGLAIVLTVMAFNVIGDGLRDALDPQQVG